MEDFLHQGLIPTDLYYTTMDLNPLSFYPGILDLPDMHGGRISVDNADELSIVIDKIINYEKNPYLEEPQWFNTLNLSAYFQYFHPEGNSPYTQECDAYEEYYFTYTSWMLDQYLFYNTTYNINEVFFNEFYNLFPGETLCWEWLEVIPPEISFIEDGESATNAVINCINNGCFLIIHNDHGVSKNFINSPYYEEGWVLPSFNQNHIPLLNNERMLPVMFSMNCQTAWFDGATDNQYFQYGNYDCFGELLLSKEGGGVVGFIGASRSARGAYTDELCKGLFDAIWQEYDPSNYNNQTPTYKLGAIKDYGLFFMYDKYILQNTSVPYNYDVFGLEAKYNRRQFEIFHVLGDPTLEIWTGVPQPLYAYVDYEQNRVTVYDDNDQVIPDAKVVLQHGEDYQVKMTDVNGQVYSTLLNNYDVEVSTLKHNYIPWFSTKISSNTTWDTEEEVRGNIIITNNGNLTFSDNINIPKYSRIIVMEGGTLTTSENTNISFNNSYNDIVAFGNLSFGQNTSFAMAGPGQGSIKLLNETTAYFFNDINFNTFKITGIPLSVALYQSSLQNCVLEIEKANVSLTTIDFNNSYLSITKPWNKLSYAHIIENCKFYNTDDAIYIDGYLNYLISGCEVYECQDAIRIFNAGGSSTEKTITLNNIHDNSGTGLTIYHSYSDVLHNLINNNGYGIKCLNRSEVHLEGDSHEVTQEIKDNNYNEVYASKGSFPQYFHWNLVQDDYNQPDDPMVLYDGTEEGLDVKYNCWGNTFNPETDLSPAGSYIWNPVWECDLGSGSGEGSEAEAMYLDARDEAANENYAAAKSGFQAIVVQYPATKYAQASLKELFSLETFISNDYETLKAYYNTEPNILSNTDLIKLADFLANFCEIKLENWPTAIAWFENVIQNPESLEDSIFAIIDLGYTYFLMENGGLKSTYAGNLTEHIPVSEKQFVEKRDYLLSLLPDDLNKDYPIENLNSLREGELLQNIPNPFKGITEIWYKLGNDSNVEITIFNNSGQLIRSFNLGFQTKGNHFIEFNGSNLPDGIYYYSIIINGKTTDSKKMTIMK